MSTPVLLQAYQTLFIRAVLRPEEEGSNVLEQFIIFYLIKNSYAIIRCSSIIYVIFTFKCLGW